MMPGDNDWVSVLRVILVVANVFVAVYALTSAGRMTYQGSLLGRVALGAYCIAQVVAQTTLFGTPFTVRTWASVPATVLGLIWFGREVWLSRRQGITR